VTPQTDPVAQAKGLRTIAITMVLAGLLVGVALPVHFLVLGIQVAMTPWGFDAVWLVLLTFMILDFVLARMFWRRATTLERSVTQGKAVSAP
jgi:Na+-driven multidrug efflux pump